MKNKRLAILAAIIAIGLGIFQSDLHTLLTLESLRQYQQQLASEVSGNPVRSALVFMTIYVLVTALSIPGAVIMTLAGGALFGLMWGTVLVSISSTLGATLAFLIARLFFGPALQEKLADKFKKVSAGFEQDGAWYLFSLRLVPVFPFFAINLLMALTSIRWYVYLLVSMAGMFPATVVYVNAGTQLSTVTSPGDILSTRVIFSFLLIAALPWIAKLLVRIAKKGHD